MDQSGERSLPDLGMQILQIWWKDKIWTNIGTTTTTVSSPIETSTLDPTREMIWSSSGMVIGHLMPNIWCGCPSMLWWLLIESQRWKRALGTQSPYCRSPETPGWARPREEISKFLQTSQLQRQKPNLQRLFLTWDDWANHAWMSVSARLLWCLLRVSV